MQCVCHATLCVCVCMPACVHYTYESGVHERGLG